MDFKGNLSWLILLWGKKMSVGHIVNTPFSSQSGTGETDLGPALACCYLTARLEGDAFSQQLFSAAAFLMQVRLAFLAQKTDENHLPSAELALQQFSFSWLRAWPCLGIFTVRGRRIKFKQVRIRFCAFMILIGVVPWRLLALWLLCLGSSSWSPARQEAGETGQGWLKINRVYEPEITCHALRKGEKWLSGLFFQALNFM